MLLERLPSIAELDYTFARSDANKKSVPVLSSVHYNLGWIPSKHKTEGLDMGEDGNEKILPGVLMEK